MKNKWSVEFQCQAMTYVKIELKHFSSVVVVCATTAKDMKRIIK